MYSIHSIHYIPMYSYYKLICLFNIDKIFYKEKTNNNFIIIYHD